MTKRKPPGFWDIKENVLSEAMKHKTSALWRTYSKSSYNKAAENGWLEEALLHMEPSSFWKSKANVLADAKKYSTKSEWKFSNSKAYRSALRNGWLDDACAHMTVIKKPRGYWTKSKVIESALKFKSIKEWRNSESGAWNKANSGSYMDEVSSHMTRIGNNYSRCIYSITIRGTNLCYVGLTFNFDQRISDHMKSKRFVNLSAKHGKTAILATQLTGYLSNEEAIAAEAQTIDEFKRLGYEMLNVAKAGSLGGGTFRKWTKEIILKDALLYKTVREWRKNSTAYDTAYRIGIVPEATSHMTKQRKWTKEECVQDAARFATQIEWIKNSENGYRAALRNGWLSESLTHISKSI